MEETIKQAFGLLIAVMAINPFNLPNSPLTDVQTASAASQGDLQGSMGQLKKEIDSLNTLLGQKGSHLVATRKDPFWECGLLHFITVARMTDKEWISTRFTPHLIRGRE